MKNIQVNRAAIIKTTVFVILPIVLVLVAFYIYRQYYFGNVFINKTLLRKDMEFKFFTWDEFDSRKGSLDVGLSTYFRNSGEYITDSGKENFSLDTILRLDAARDKVEQTWNIANPNKRIVFIINSAFRTDSRNEEIGGKVNSAHRNITNEQEKATAVDISWYKYDNEQKQVIEAALREQGFNRIGKANGFIHADNSKRLVNPANWTY